jgi:hemerythrin
MESAEIIKRTIEEHMSLKSDIKLVGDSVSDYEALAKLASESTDWIPGSSDDLREKQDKLRQTLGYLDEGLRNHFAFEEELLPPLLGDLLMRALAQEHQRIGREIDRAKSLVDSMELQGLGRDELISKQSKVKQVINNICKLIEDHSGKEEVLLGMAGKALEER